MSYVNGTIKSLPTYAGSGETYNAARPVSAIIIGAGVAGIGTAVLLQAKVPNLTYTVLERNAGVGGVWFENHYPGARCDIPAHSYQLSFEPNPSWSEFYPAGPEIRAYYESVVKKHGVDKHLRLSHEVRSARWLPEASQWVVDGIDLLSGEAFTVQADFLVSATGRQNGAEPPDIPGLGRFQGPVVHTARWDDSVALDGKRVAVIGNGASGVQIIPELLPRVQRLLNFVRSRNWVAAAVAHGLSDEEAEPGNPAGHAFTEAQRQTFETDTAAHLAYRKKLEANFHKGTAASVLGSEANEQLRRDTTALMAKRVGNDPKLLAQLIPDYAPGCKRPTPSPGYLESLRDKRVDLVTEPIETVTKTGLLTTDGTTHEVDVIITATGFPPHAVPRFPVVGRDGQDIRTVWSPGGAVGYARSYFGVMAPGFPNYFFVLQTQGSAKGGTVPVHGEQTAVYVAKCMRKVQSQSYAALEPSEAATAEFDAVVEGYFADKATADSCHGWWKNGPGHARVLISWPGTGHHKWDISRSPRWEDFVYVRRAGAEANRFHYFGSGTTVKDEQQDPDVLTAYLSEAGKVDLRELYESWTQGY